MLENSPAAAPWELSSKDLESAWGNESVTYDNKMKAQLEYFIY